MIGEVWQNLIWEDILECQTRGLRFLVSQKMRICRFLSGKTVQEMSGWLKFRYIHNQLYLANSLPFTSLWEGRKRQIWKVRKDMKREVMGCLSYSLRYVTPKLVAGVAQTLVKNLSASYGPSFQKNANAFKNLHIISGGIQTQTIC